MAPLPLVTWVTMASTEFFPFFSRSACFRVLVGIITLPPLIWQATQLALKILAPDATSPARAGRPKAKVTTAIASNTAEISFFKRVLLVSTVYSSKNLRKKSTSDVIQLTATNSRTRSLPNFNSTAEITLKPISHLGALLCWVSWFGWVIQSYLRWMEPKYFQFHSSEVISFSHSKLITHNSKLPLAPHFHPFGWESALEIDFAAAPFAANNFGLDENMTSDRS